MKILLLTDRMDMGGAETHIACLARGLRARGDSVVIASFGGRVAEQLRAEGFCHLRLRFSRKPWDMIKALFRLRRLLKKEKFDIVHAHARLPAFLLRFCRGLCGARVVTVHARFCTNALLSRLCYWGERTLAVSEDLRAYVGAHYAVPPDRVQVIPNGIDCARFSPAEPAETDRLHVVFASRLDADCSQGAALLLDLAEELKRNFPTFTLTIAGDGSEARALSRRAEQINRRTGKRFVQAVGYVSDMASLLRTCDVFVGVSRAAMEAAACGCAVLLCGNEGYLGVLDASCLSLAASGNFCARGCENATREALLRDLSGLLSSPARRAVEAACVRAWVLEHCNAERTVDMTRALYLSALPSLYGNRLVIGGYFGCGNMGDDAILAGLLAALPPDICPTVLSGKPKSAQERLGVSCIGRKNPFSLLLAAKRARVFAYGGGSVLQNLTGMRSLWYYLFLLRLFRLMGCKTALVGSGIGPLIGRRAEQRTARELSHCAHIGLRDERSLAHLRSLGLRKNLHSGADFALLMPLPPSSRTRELYAAADLEPGSALLIIVRGGRAAQATHRLLSAVLPDFCSHYGLKPCFLIMDESMDGAATRALFERLGGRLLPCATPSDALAWMRGARCVLTQRLHGAILSTLAARPALGIPADARDQKLAAFCEASGQALLSPENLTPARLQKALTALFQAPPSPQSQAEKLACMQKKARRDLDALAKSVYNSSK